ncbi:twin-arginine translocase subunit TatC [Scrofimicrobium sp. R131]|uniref:Sec-independent protein translocase protein TatC n=1 Tax=Scrofimicrobium appendicitidis TaxID=3079930 RepID=A0AAU7V644_9ACTO
MTVLAHLKELRKRLLLILLGLLVGTIVGWFFTMPVLEYIQRPLLQLTDANPRLNFQTIGGAFDLRLRVAFWTGAILSSPWWILQIGLFVWPGLRRKERLHALGFGVAGVILFGAGVVAGIKVVPQAIDILVSFLPGGAEMLLRADSYLSFYMTLVFAFGFSFLLPEILVALNFAGILPAKAMLKAWRWAVLVAFVIAAIINPIPNPIPMIIQAFGLIALYLVAVGISWWRERIIRKRRSDPTSTPEVAG